MTYIIIAIVVLFVFIIIYTAFKGMVDLNNVNKYGGLRFKYGLLIKFILERNPLYQFKEINPNNIELLNTGIKFKLTEYDKNLLVVWYWTSFSTKKTYKLIWKFNEFFDQNKMYEIINKDITIQKFIDDGMTVKQAEEWFNIIRTNDKELEKKLTDMFSKEYPNLWTRMTGEHNIQ